MDLTFVMSETPARWKTISTFLVIFFNFVKFERLDFIKLIFLNFGLLPTFTMSIIIVMLGFYLDQNIALSFNLSKKEFLKK